MSPGLRTTCCKLAFIHDVCMLLYKNFSMWFIGSLSHQLLITFSTRCAMDEDGGRGDVEVDEDTCLGDSGSPMIVAGLGKDGEGDVQVSTFDRNARCPTIILTCSHLIYPTSDSTGFWLNSHYLFAFFFMQVGIVSWGM